jgi:hypothetical protein
MNFRSASFSELSRQLASVLPFCRKSNGTVAVYPIYGNRTKIMLYSPHECHMFLDYELYRTVYQPHLFGKFSDGV